MNLKKKNARKIQRNLDELKTLYTIDFMLAFNLEARRKKFNLQEITSFRRCCIYLLNALTRNRKVNTQLLFGPIVERVKIEEADYWNKDSARFLKYLRRNK